MSETGSSSLGANSELDDPGRDPKGLDPPRNPFGGGPDQDSGRGDPTGSPGTGGPVDDAGVADRGRRPAPDRRLSRRATPRTATPAATSTAGPVSTVVPGSTCTDRRPPGTSTTTVPRCRPAASSAA